MAITVLTDTYITLANARAYVSAAGLTPLPTNDADAESLLKKATITLDRVYGSQYIGMKATIAQPLAWLRSFAAQQPHGTGEWPYITFDSIGNPRDFSQLQPELGQAQCELAVMIQGGVDPYAQPEPFLSVERSKVSSLEQEKQYKSAQGYRADPLYKVALILKPLLKASSGSVAITRGA